MPISRAVLPALLLSLIGSSGLAHADETIDDFLARHWSRPLAPQGQAPEIFSPLEASLNAADCGQCHVEQFRDWQTARHAHAMGPGLMGQLVTMAPAARREHQDCLRCHAPLAEQADALVAAISAATAALAPPETPAGALPPATGIHAQGLTCAACHVRANQHIGPPRRDGSAPDASRNATLPHGGFTDSAAFEDSRFCATCHQFQPGEFALNGKLLENTLNEWQSSRHAREGRSCQSCHMPDRRHLWRGIHDPEMVRNGVSFLPEPPATRGKSVRAALLVRNSGTGHAFPTYVTPRVIVEIEQLGADGRPLRGTRVERIIQRKVPLDLSLEIFDTRLPPDGEIRLAYRQPRARGAATLAFRMRVEPDEYYVRFYRSLLARGKAGRGAALIREALAQAESSGFVAFERHYPL